MITKWYVKDLSKLTGVSVQTLHHYDRINLLKPSLRLDNGYRLYSERDLLKLQQIIALKFFGFELSQINSLLAGDVKMKEHFKAQVRFLEEKANTLMEASQALKTVINDCSDESIPWKTIIKLIEVYHMTEQLENTWVKEIFTPEELRQYAAFEAELKTSSGLEKKAIFHKKWDRLLEEINNNLKLDPKSEKAINLAEKYMQVINEFYGRKYAYLRTRIFEKGFGEGKGLSETGLTPEILSWIEQAIDQYFRKRIHSILAQVGKAPSAELIKNWNEVLDDMYGEEEERKKTITHAVMHSNEISQEAKRWLQEHAKYN
jgi:DNA-binding transcriptional MerR regulator